MTRISWRTVLLAGVAGAGLAAASARAEDAAASSVAEVVVTAQKRAENVQQVPIAITAMTSNDLNRRGISSVRDLASHVPAVNFGEVSGTTQISARGVGFGLLTGVGENSVATQRDGVYIPRAGAAGMLFDDVARIEFLRGPQGTLYGRNATGGVLNLISPAPSAEPEGGFTLGGGNYDAFRASAYAGGPLGAQVRVRAYLGRDSHDGYVRNTVTGQRLDDLHRWTGHVALDADLADNFTLEARAYTVQDHVRGPVYDPIDPAGSATNPLPASVFDPAPFRIKADGNYDSSRSISGGSLRLGYDFGAVRLLSITGVQLYKYGQRTYDGDGTAVPLYVVQRQERSTSNSQEFDLIGTTGAVDWTVGAYYLYDQDKSRFGTATPGFVPAGIESLTQAGKEKSKYASVFGDLTWRVTDRLAVYGGVRGLREDRKDLLLNTLNLVGGVVVPLCTPTTPGGSLEIERSDVTGRLGVRYAPDSRSNLYLQYARGSKSGGFGISACGNTFRPEQLDAFELGWKNELLGRTLRVNAAAYYYDYKDLQVEQITGTSLFIQNAPKSRIYGVEVEALWAPDAHWEVSLGASAMRARYVTFSDADPIKPQLGLLDLSGERLNRAPDWTLGLGVQYTLDLPGGAALRPRADLYATGSYALRPYGDPADQQSSYATVSLSLAWLSTDRRWTVRAYGRNITNEAYLQGVVGNPGEGRLGAYAPPRTWGAELSAKF